jgi:hypothetical protein
MKQKLIGHGPVQVFEELFSDDVIRKCHSGGN